MQKQLVIDTTDSISDKYEADLKLQMNLLLCLFLLFLLLFSLLFFFLFFSCPAFYLPKAVQEKSSSHRSRRPLNYFMHNGTKATLRSKSDKEKRLHRSNSSHVITEDLNSCLSSLCVRKSMYLIKVIVNCQMTVDRSGCWSEKHMCYFSKSH